MPRAAIVSVIALLFPTGTAGAQESKEQEPASLPPSVAAYAAPSQEPNWRQDILVALIGGGARFRRVQLDVGDLSGGEENRSLDTGAYFDFGWFLLIRPMGHRSPRASLRALVLQFEGGSGIGLDVQPAGTGITLQTNTWRLLGQVGYLHPLHRLLVGGLAGVGVDAFSIDLNSVLPSSRIAFVRFGPAIEYEIVADTLKARADFGLRFPFQLGEIANAFGADSSAFGLDSTLSLGGRIEAGFTYAFRFIWEYYRLRFNGPIDDVPAQGDGGRGTDHAFDVQFLVGWSL